MKFNPDEYEPVEERVKRFYKDYPNGAILTKLESSADNMDYAVFSAEVMVDGTIRARGWAQEIRDKELSKNKQGYEYESVNYTSWLENAETSAIGRALANFNYAGSKRPSREEMQKAQRRSGGNGREPEPPPADTSFLRDGLLSLLTLVQDTVGKPKADALREAIQSGKHDGDVAWFEKAIAATKAKVQEQEALLAANATKAAETIPFAEPKLEKPKDEVQQAMEAMPWRKQAPKPSKSGELTLEQRGITDHE